MRWLPLPLLAGACLYGHAQVVRASDAPAAGERDSTWHARVGIALNPVVSDAELPRVHTGFGASLSGFLQLPYRLSAGAGFDWERYTFDSRNSGDPYDAAPRYTGEELVHTRLMALVQWDVLRRNVITPYVLAGLGYGWEDAKLKPWQCSPPLMSGLVLGAGAGLDLELHELVSVGVEYRFNTLPNGSLDCTLAFFPDEPLGPPSDFSSQRVGITLSLRH